MNGLPLREGHAPLPVEGVRLNIDSTAPLDNLIEVLEALTFVLISGETEIVIRVVELPTGMITLKIQEAR